MKRKSILLITNYPPPFGGVPRHIEYLVPYLAEKGWEVHVLLYGKKGIERKADFTLHRFTTKLTFFNFAGSLLKAKKAHIAAFKSVITDSRRDWLRYSEFTSLGKRLIKKNGISIIGAYNLFSYAPIGAMLSEECGIPLVATNLGEIHGLTDFFKKHIKMVKYVCYTARKLLACSQHCADSYKLLGLSPDVEAITYGVDIRRFSSRNDGSEIKYKLGLSDEDKVVLFVGRLTADMGLPTLMEAIPYVLQANGRVKFLIVGQTRDLLPFAIELSGKHKGRVFVISDVSLEELPAYYAISNIVVVPTRGDRACSSLAAMEAMATARPVIASKVGGIPEVVIDKLNGLLIPSEDPLVLGESILSLLKDPVLMEKMGAAGRARAETLFDKDQTNQKIEKLFSEIRNE